MKEYPVIDLAATGKRIRQLRKERDLRVEDISEYMGFESVQAVYKWQRGESLPTVDNLYALPARHHNRRPVKGRGCRAAANPLRCYIKKPPYGGFFV